MLINKATVRSDRRLPYFSHMGAAFFSRSIEDLIYTFCSHPANGEREPVYGACILGCRKTCVNRNGIVLALWVIELVELVQANSLIGPSQDASSENELRYQVDDGSRKTVHSCPVPKGGALASSDTNQQDPLTWEGQQNLPVARKWRLS